MKKGTIWGHKVGEQDFAAAQKYLALLFTQDDAEQLVRSFRAAPFTEYAAKDLLRASQTHLLDKENPEVAKDLKKIRKGKRLVPVLLVRGDGDRGATLTIADGYHRICASWLWDEECPVAAYVVDHPSSFRSRTKKRLREKRVH